MRKQRKERSAFFWVVIAFCCFGSAFVAGISGSLLTTTWILNGQLHPWLRGLGLVCLIFTVPVFVLGGHFLDLGDRKDQGVTEPRVSCYRERARY